MEEINATIRNLRQQKSFESKLTGIDQEYKKAMKRNYYQWLETLHQLRHEKELKKGLEYFSESEWRQSRKSLNEKKLETTQNMSLGAKQGKKSSTSNNTQRRLVAVTSYNIELL